MDIRTETQKTHFITMDDKDMSTLMAMLAQYKQYIADKMPNGMAQEEREVFGMFYQAQTGRSYLEARSFEPSPMAVQTSVPDFRPQDEERL